MSRAEAPNPASFLSNSHFNSGISRAPCPPWYLAPGASDQPPPHTSRATAHPYSRLLFQTSALCGRMASVVGRSVCSSPQEEAQRQRENPFPKPDSDVSENLRARRGCAVYQLSGLPDRPLKRGSKGKGTNTVGNQSSICFKSLPRYPHLHSGVFTGPYALVTTQNCTLSLLYVKYINKKSSRVTNPTGITTWRTTK